MDKDAGKRFLLFSGHQYYPSGGWDDFRGSYATIAAAMRRVSQLQKKHGFDWYQIVERCNGLVWNSNG